MRRDFHRVEEPPVMIIPMIDIMLFLLVFFMLATMYMVNTSTVQVSLPQAASAVPEIRPNIVSITVTEEGKVLYDKDDAPVENLAQTVHDTLVGDPETVFVVRGDRKANYEHVVTVFDILKKSGTRHVSIATETKQ